MSIGLKLYLVFIVSWFLHLGARIELLGTMRVDLMLVVVLVVLAAKQYFAAGAHTTQTERILRALIAYSILTIPFVEWPGSVIKDGLQTLIKAIVFYYFTVAFIESERDLRRFLVVFLACQLFRILEPLYLHVAFGYWGSQASMSGWESLDRLSGAPSDVVNPNGLAFIVCTVLPFLYFMASFSRAYKLAALVFVPVSIYVLLLTGSRSGLIGLFVICAGVVYKSKSRLLMVAVPIAGIALIGSLSMLSPDMQDRYLSIIGKGEKNASTAEDRWEGMEDQLNVAMRRPFFGHGIGTSPEANGNFSTSGPYAGRTMPAHNLYLEIVQELGLIGLAIFLVFIKSIFSGFRGGDSQSFISEEGSILARLKMAMQVWLIMNIVFSLVSYGLTSYEWYLFAGLSVVAQRLSTFKKVLKTEMKLVGTIRYSRAGLER